MLDLFGSTLIPAGSKLYRHQQEVRRCKRTSSLPGDEPEDGTIGNAGDALPFGISLPAKSHLTGAAEGYAPIPVPDVS
jgi:hypothetical protein